MQGSLRHPAALGAFALLLAALAGCQDRSPTAAAPAAVESPRRLDRKPTSPSKYQFTGVALTDADGSVIQDATIRASSKLTGNGTGDTVCGYFTADDAFLGQYQAATFTSAADIEQFCVDHFAARQTR